MESIEPIFSSALEQQQSENDPAISLWPEKRASLLQRWQTVLGTPDYGAFEQTKEITEIKTQIDTHTTNEIARIEKLPVDIECICLSIKDISSSNFMVFANL